MFDAPILSYYATHEGRSTATMVGPVFLRENYGIVFPTGSPLVEDVNHVSQAEERPLVMATEAVDLTDAYVVEIEPGGLLGGVQVAIDPGTGPRVLKADEALKGRVKIGGLEAVGDLFGDEALGDDVRGIARGIREAVDRLNAGEGSLGKALVDPALYDELLASLQHSNFRDVALELTDLYLATSNGGSGELAQISIPSLCQSYEQFVTNVALRRCAQVAAVRVLESVEAAESLAATLADPFDGESLRTRVLEDGLSESDAASIGSDTSPPVPTNTLWRHGCRSRPPGPWSPTRALSSFTGSPM